MVMVVEIKDENFSRFPEIPEFNEISRAQRSYTSHIMHLVTVWQVPKEILYYVMSHRIPLSHKSLPENPVALILGPKPIVVWGLRPLTAMGIVI
jgi:hypothetical protein